MYFPLHQLHQSEPLYSIFYFYTFQQFCLGHSSSTCVINFMTTYDFLYWFWLYNPPYFTISNSIIFIVQCISIHATNLHGTNFFIRFIDTACNVTSDEKNFLLFFLCCCLSNNIDLKVTFLLPEGKWTIHQYSWVISPFRLSWTAISTATNLPTTFIIVLLPHIDWLVSKNSSTRSTIWFFFDSLTMFLSMS